MNNFDLATLRRKISDQLGALGVVRPRVVQHINLIPTSDPTFGDITSDVALQSVRQDCSKGTSREHLSLDPLILAEQLAQRLCEHEGMVACAQRGFINFRIPFCRSVVDSDLSADTVPVTILLPGCSRVAEERGRLQGLRLLAVALLQAELCHSLRRISGGLVSVLVRETVLPDAGLLASFLQGGQILGSYPASDYQREAESIEVCLNRLTQISKAQRVVVFISPETFSHVEFRLLATSINAFAPGSRIFTTAQEWAQLSPECMAHLNVDSEDCARRTLWYLAGPLIGTDIDAMVPHVQDREELCWFIESTLARIYRVVGLKIGSVDEEQTLAPKTASICPAGSVLAPRLRAIWVRGALLPVLRWRAALYGEVLALVSVLRQLLIDTNLELNDPHFRHQLRQHVQTDETAAILYGVAQQLSAILTDARLS